MLTLARFAAAEHVSASRRGRLADSVMRLGGLVMPLLSLIAGNHGPPGAFVVLAAILLPAIAMSTTLREPAHDIFPSDT